MYSHQSSKCMFTKAACFNFGRCVFFTSVLFISCDYFTVIGYKCLFVWSVDLCLLPIEYHFSTDLGNTIKIKTVKPFRKFIQDTSFDFWGPHAYIYIRYKLRMLFVCLVFYVDAQVQSLFVFGKFVKGLSLSHSSWLTRAHLKCT